MSASWERDLLLPAGVSIHQAPTSRTLRAARHQLPAMVKEVTASHAQDRHNQEPAAEHVASTSAHEMAKEASRNAPARRRRAPVKQRSRLYKAFHALPDYLKDNEVCCSSGGSAALTRPCAQG